MNTHQQQIQATQATTPLRVERKCKRTHYTEGERKATLGRLTTRCPTLLRDYLKYASSNPTLGYRTMTHMVTVCLIEFLGVIRKNEAPALWAQGRGARADSVLVHANTERSGLVVNGDGDEDGDVLDGIELAAYAKHVADAQGVSLSAFTLTLLTWIANVKHPATNAKMRREIAKATQECFA